MAKITLTRLLETSQVLSTEAGQQIQAFVNYMADFVEQTVKALQGGLTFNDNFSGVQKNVSLKHNTEQIVQATKPVTGILCIRVISKTYGLDSFAWYYDDGGRLTVKATFTGGPNYVGYYDQAGTLTVKAAFTGAPTSALDCTLVLLF